MKRDLRINYANLKYIQRQLIQYVEEIRALSAAANVFLAVMQAQDSDAYKKLRKHWNDKVIDSASMLSGRLEQVAENLGGYISAMTTYIAPVDESREMRVDRNDIWFNYIQIGVNTRDYWDIFGDRGSSWDNYRRWFCYNPFESEEANNNRRNRMRSEDDAESSRRKGNYDKLQSFRDKMFRLLSVDAENHISKIRDIHQNNVIPYENMDDEYNKKLHSLYKEWATLGDVIRDNWNESVDFYRGAFKAVVDLVGGIAGLLWNLTEMQFYPTLQLFGIVPKWMQNDMDRLEQTVILLFTDPGQAVETIGQNIFDTADEEGIAFSAGYVIVDIAVEILVSKGLDKLKAAKMADDIVGVAEDVAKYADDVVDAVGDVAKYADDVVDAAGDVAKYADDVVDAAGDLTKYADDVVDAAGDLTKYADDVVDTAEDLAKHADEVADTAEDLVRHVDDLDGMPGKIESSGGQGIGGGNTGATGGLCFVGGTLILTEKGYKEIEHIQVGDKVYSQYINSENEKGYKIVSRIFNNKTDTLIEITVNNTKIRTTRRHRFYLFNKGWIEAEKLEIEDKLVNANGLPFAIQSIQQIFLNEAVEVFNFEVSDWHTYFVSKSAILVHNDCDAGARRWHQGSYDSAEESLLEHFKKHGNEVGASTVEQYLRKAQAYARNLKGATKAHVSGATKGVIRYYKNGKYIDMVDDMIISFGKQ